ncbi:hypothetical protein STENM223S_09027 [Streptomyces tendae]
MSEAEQGGDIPYGQERTVSSPGGTGWETCSAAAAWGRCGTRRTKTFEPKS